MGIVLGLSLKKTSWFWRVPNLEGPNLEKFSRSLGPATTQNLVVKFDGEICGGVLVENASADFPQEKKRENLLPNFAGSSPPIPPKTSPTSLWKSLVLRSPSRTEIFKRDWNEWHFQARLKISSKPPTKPMFLWGILKVKIEKFQARLKFSSEIGNFKRKLEILKRSSEIDFFSRFGPSANPPGANPLAAERAPWRSSQSCVTGGQQPIGNP